MSAGRGVLHSEWNPSKDEGVHFLQIWILPEKQALAPSYEEKHFPEAERRNAFRLLVSPDARAGSLKVHQDAEIWGTVLDAGAETTVELRPGRSAWVQVARGKLTLNGTELGEGDGAQVERETRLVFRGVEAAEALLFDLA